VPPYDCAGEHDLHGCHSGAPSRLGNALVALLYRYSSSGCTLDPRNAGRRGADAGGDDRPADGTLYQGDQRFVIGTIATNVQKLLRGPRALAGFGSAIRCAPRTPSASTCRREPARAPFYVATGEPVLATTRR